MDTLLFALFINIIVDVVKNLNIEIFADDCRLSITVKSRQDAINLQEDLDRVASWIDRNKLKINEDKCQKITFNRRNDIINFTCNMNRKKLNEYNKIRDLGIVLDRK